MKLREKDSDSFKVYGGGFGFSNSIPIRMDFLET
jgi:hypothetical protein